MKTFIKGTFRLAQNVKDLESYENAHRAALESIIDFANHNDISVTFGTMDDDSYAVEYRIVKKNHTVCNNVLTDLKAKLRSEWGKITNLFQAAGDYLG